MSLSSIEVGRAKDKIKELKKKLAQAKKSYESEKKYCREHCSDPTLRFDPDPCSEATEHLLANVRSLEGHLKFFQNILNGKIDLDTEITNRKMEILNINKNIVELQEQRRVCETKLTNLVLAKETLS